MPRQRETTRTSPPGPRLPYHQRMRQLAAILVVSACATTTSTCPLGTKLVVSNSADGRVEACATEDVGLKAIPVPGRSLENTSASSVPIGMPGGIEGPFSSWYPNGVLRSHGTYKNFGSRSVPDGVWAFWDPNGQRRTLGTYHRGEAVGCFATWNDAGERATGHVEGGELRLDGCAAPSDEMLIELEGRGRVAPPERANVTLTLSAGGGVGGMGARSSTQAEYDPRVLAAFRLSGRKELGRWGVGPVLGLSTSTADYSGYSAALAVTYQLWRPHPRIATEVGVELGARYTQATAFRSMQLGTAQLGFWSPLPGAQVAASLQLSPSLSAVVGARVEGTPWRSVERDVTYCDFVCYQTVTERWRAGGFVGELVAALRLTIR
jgi:hypothetical protein